MTKIYLQNKVTLLACTSLSLFNLAANNKAEYNDSAVVKLRAVEVVANSANSKTPIAYTNVTAKQIATANDGRDIPFLLESVPSVMVTGDAGGGIGYSSISVRGTDASRINVTANGVPINDSESHRVYWVNMPDLVSSVKEIQVQRGAGTSTNGAGAFGASINMATDAPSRERHASVMLSYGSYNANRQTVKVGSGTFGDHWSIDARFSHIGSDGYIDRAFSKLWSYQGQIAYSASKTLVRLLAFGGKEQTYMAWDYASAEEMEKYGRRYNPCGKYTDKDGNTAFYPNQCDNFIQHHIQLLLTHNFNNSWSMNGALHYTSGNGYYEQYKTSRTLVEYGLQPFLDADGNTVKKSDLIRKKYNVNDFGGAIFNVKYRNGASTATFGSAINYFHGGHYGEVAWVRNYMGPLDPLQRYYDNTGRKVDFNIYSRGDWSIINDLTAYADLQYRHIHYTIKGASDNYDWNTGALANLDILRNYNFFNPKVGVNYTHNNHRAFVSWSVAHKEPVRDNFTDADPDRLPVAERMFDYELGYNYTSRLFNVGLNLYFMDYKNQLVVTGQLSDTGNAVSVNVPSSYRAGIELQAGLRPLNWFNWEATATFSRNRIKNFVEYIYEDEWTNPVTFDRGDTPIAFSPSVLFHNSFNFNVKGFDAKLSTQYVSRQYMNNARSAEAILDPFCVSNLHLGYTFNNLHGIKTMRLGFAIYNLFNEKYCNNGYTGAGYYVEGKEKVIYRYAGYAAQATTNVMGTIALNF